MNLISAVTLAYLPPFSKFAVLGRSFCLIVLAKGREEQDSPNYSRRILDFVQAYEIDRVDGGDLI